MSLEPKRAYKVVLIGDPEVGKTSIRRRYMGKTFKGEYLKTIGADFAARKVEVEGETVLLTIWDLAGQSIFHGMRSSFYQGCKSALVVFDVTNEESLKNVRKWAEEAFTYAKSSLQEIYLIGNKIDLEEQRVVNNEMIKNTAKVLREISNFPVRIYETSALTGENIHDLFMDLSRKLIIGDNLSIEEKIPINLQSKEKNDLEKTNQHQVKHTHSSTKTDDIISTMETHVEQIQLLLKKLKELQK